MSNWATKSSLTNKELECLNNISALFQTKPKEEVKEVRKEEEDGKEEFVLKADIAAKSEDQGDELNDLIQDAQTILNDLEQRGKQNFELVQQIEFNKGQVLANTKDFQQSCISILNREKMLTKVAREIERYLQHYKNYDECYFILNHQEITDDPKELLQILNKIQQGVTFFKKNYDFKKADIFLKRFEKLKQQALEKINIKVLKILRETNAEINLRVISSEIFEKVKTLEDLKVSQIFYAVPKPEKLFEVVKLFIITIEEKYKGMGEYHEFVSIIYDEYFDNRIYLLDLYMSTFTRLLAEKNFSLDDYILLFLNNYEHLIQSEENYFNLQFGPNMRFNMFKRDYETDLINKYIKPRISSCQDYSLLCQTIDRAREDEIARLINEETCQKLFIELEEKLQQLFRTRVGEIFYNTNLLGIKDFDKVEFPLDFIEKLKGLLQDLKLRTTGDVYRGLMLEVVQKILAEHMQPFMEQYSDKVEPLVVVMSNLMYLQQNLLGKQGKRDIREEYKVEVLDSQQEIEEVEPSTEEFKEGLKKERLAEDVMIEELLAQPSLMESIWQYVAETTAQYTSIFSFIEESIPKLKRIQMEDMNKIFDNRIQSSKKRLFKNFVKESLKGLKTFQQELKVDFRNMTSQDKEALFKSYGDPKKAKDCYQKYSLSRIKEIYLHSLQILSQKYVEFNQKTQKVSDKLGVEGVVVLAQIKEELRIKCLNYFQKFQQFLSQYYDKQQYEDLGLKSGKEMLTEVFGLTD